MRKICKSPSGKLFGRQYAGIFIIEAKYSIWIPEKSINNDKQDKYVNNSNPIYYRFQSDTWHYLYFDKAIIIPEKYTQPKDFLSNIDRLKLNEINTNRNVIEGKLDFCIKHQRIDNFTKMKSVFDIEEKTNSIAKQKETQKELEPEPEIQHERSRRR